MNKRIQKKIAKREHEEHGTEHELGVVESFHALTNALVSEGREKSAAAMASVRSSIERGEANVEELIAKVPAVGPQLAQMIHKLAHGEQEKDASAKHSS